MNIFAKASKLKLLFSAQKGQVSLQDLWDLPTSKLRVMANTLNRGLTKPDDLFAVTTTAENHDKLRLDIIMEVLETRETENTAKITAEETAQKRELLKSLIQQKKLEATSSMSIEDLEAELAKT